MTQVGTPQYSAEDLALILSGGIPSGAGNITATESPSLVDSFIQIFTGTPEGHKQVLPGWVMPVAIGGAVLVVIALLNSK